MKRTRYKLLSAILLCALLAACLGGCAKTAEPASETTAEAAAEAEAATETEAATEAEAATETEAAAEPEAAAETEDPAAEEPAETEAPATGEPAETEEPAAEPAATETTETAEAQTEEETSALQPGENTAVPTKDYSKADMEDSYDAGEATSVNLSDLTGSVYTIDQGGDYLLTGSYNGQLVIQAPETDKVRLILDNAEITCATGPAVYVLSTDKLILTLAEGTENSITDGVDYTPDAEGADAALYSKSDVSINGSGSLTVNGQTAHGIVTKDDFVMTGGTLTVTAVKDGIRGKDSVSISNGSFVITAGSDGIISTSTELDKGFVLLDGGSYTILAGGDGIQAAGSLQVNGGSIYIQTGGGSADLVLASDATGMGMGGGGPWGGTTATATAEETTVSQKGLKAGGTLRVTGGTLELDTVDDALHAGADAEITGGSFTISTGDDAAHADYNLLLDGGSFTVTKCYEGFEGFTVTMNSGVVDVTSSDDGFNCAGGADSSGFGAGMDWGGGFAAVEGCYIQVNGGTITVVSDGDSLDSNGDLTIAGGTLNLTCNGNGNTAIDCNGTYSWTGGDLTTNDGSENGETMTGPGGMGGGRGMSGQTPTA